MSTAPVWDNGCLISRSMVLRTYVLNTGNGWIAIPGGLVRVAESEGSVVSMQRGGHSKDAWVLWDSPVDTFSMLRPRNEPVELRRVSRVVPSSVADNVFWLGRYAERAENTGANPAHYDSSRAARGRAGTRMPGSPAPLPGVAAQQVAESQTGGRLRLELEQEMISLLTDAKRSDSLALHAGGGVSHRRQCSRAPVGRYDVVDRPAARFHPDRHGTQFLEYPAMLTDCLELLSAFSGMERENINRGLGWLFMSIGRRLERAIYLTRQLREITTPLTERDWSLLECLLEVADSSMTYRSRYYTTLQPLAVLDVLMADETNPRSFDFQLSHLADLYQKLPRHLPDDLQAMRAALTLLRSFDLRELKYPLAGAVGGQTVPTASRGLRPSSENWNDCFLHGRIIFRADISATPVPCRSPSANDL